MDDPHAHHRNGGKLRGPRLAFLLVVLVTLGLVGMLGLVLVRPTMLAGLLGHDTAGHAGAHFRSPHHRIHDLTFAVLFGTAVVGMLAQLRAPSKHVAAQLMAVIPWLALAMVIPLTNYWAAPGAGFVIAATGVFGALTVVAAILHPTGRDLFRSVSLSRANPAMLVLLIVAAVPLLAFAWINIGLQRNATNDHAALGHYGFMAAWSLTTIGVGALASLRPEGWRLSAWVAGILATFLGLASVVLPDVDSSLGRSWALAAIAWGAVFIGAAEFIGRIRDPSPLQPRAAGDRARSSEDLSTASRASCVYVIGIVGVLLAFLLVFLHFGGGGFGTHGVTR